MYFVVQRFSICIEIVNSSPLLDIILFTLFSWTSLFSSGTEDLVPEKCIPPDPPAVLLIFQTPPKTCTAHVLSLSYRGLRINIWIFVLHELRKEHILPENKPRTVPQSKNNPRVNLCEKQYSTRVKFMLVAGAYSRRP